MTSTIQSSGRPKTAPRRDRTHYLYLSVIAAVALGLLVGLVAPDFAVQL